MAQRPAAAVTTDAGRLNNNGFRFVNRWHAHSYSFPFPRADGLSGRLPPPPPAPKYRLGYDPPAFSHASLFGSGMEEGLEERAAYVLPCCFERCRSRPRD